MRPERAVASRPLGQHLHRGAKLGYTVVRQRGSHVRLACAGRPPVTVPLHGQLDRGTLRSIIRTAEISVDDFVKLVG